MVRKYFRKLLLVILAAGIVGAFSTYRHIDNKIRNSYAQWWVADMIILHLDANGQSWPQSWQDLRDDYDVCVQRSGRPWTFEELSKRVVVDWSVETQSLRNLPAQQSQAPFRVIWLSDGSLAHWQKREPNKMIAEYLRIRPPIDGVAEQSNGTESAAGSVTNGMSSLPAR